MLFEVVAEDLQADRFPNTYHCGTCGRFTTVNKLSSVPSCPNHGPMRQFTWAEIHECGHLAQLAAPRCANNDKGQMALMNTKTLRTNVWYWRCLKCGTRSNVPVVRPCCNVPKWPGPSSTAATQRGVLPADDYGA